MKRILDDPGFRIHLAVYLAVNVLLLVINLGVSPHKLWLFWPALGWGLGIAGHAFLVHRKQSYSQFNARSKLPTPPDRA